MPLRFESACIGDFIELELFTVRAHAEDIHSRLGPAEDIRHPARGGRKSGERLLLTPYDDVEIGPPGFGPARGSLLTDADGNEYLDYHAAFAPHILGHNDPEVNGAVAKAMEADWSLMGSGTTPWEIRLASINTMSRSGSRSLACSAAHSPVNPPPTIARSHDSSACKEGRASGRSAWSSQ